MAKVRELPANLGARPALQDHDARTPGISRRLLRFSTDERLVHAIRRGSEAAFEALYERHVPGLLAFCRQMLGTREEAEDAVQHTFASAYSDLSRSERRLAVKPWLYTIARNRCVSVLRARRETPAALEEQSVEALDSQVARRAEVRQMLRDLADLPERQRAALVLTELRDLSHSEVAQVLGCEVAQVKGLVFRAREGLAERREAREASCLEIRAQLASLKGGALRRNRLRHHLRSCADCRAFREEVRRQRSLMAAALPVAPSAGLRAVVLGAGAGAQAAGGGLGGALGAGAAAAAKVALVGALATGAGVGGGVAVDHALRKPDRPAITAQPSPSGHEARRGPAPATLQPAQAAADHHVRGGPAIAAQRRRGRHLAQGHPAYHSRARHAGSAGERKHAHRVHAHTLKPPTRTAHRPGHGSFSGRPAPRARAPMIHVPPARGGLRRAAKLGGR